MKCQRFVCFVLCLITALPGNLKGVSPSNRVLLDSLDRVIAKRDDFQQARELRIEQYKHLLDDSSLNDQKRYNINEIIAGEYTAFICDSIIQYQHLNIELARKMNDPVLENSTRLQLANTLTLSGMYIQALGELESIHREALRTDKEKEEYYFACHNLYRELISHTRHPATRTGYVQTSNYYLDSLRTVVDPKSDLYLDLEQRREWGRGNLEKALEINARRLGSVSRNEPKYAVIRFWRALLLEQAGEMDEYFENLIHSAIADIRTATKDNTSLRMIANMLFTEGDIERANRYIQVSMEDARFYNARLRGIQLNTTVPLIISTYNAKIDSQMTRLRVMLWVISAMLLLILVLSFYLIRHKNRLERAQKELKSSHEALRLQSEELNRANDDLNTVNRNLIEANYVKENYIGQYLRLSSSFMDRLEGLRRVVNKKMREGKNAEVLDMTRPSTRLAEMELNEFYTHFDTAFLAIYPTFIEEFNRLLIPEERIHPETRNGNPTLTTELRVFALIRLGLKDSSAIANMLRYSVNTIYNIRAQVKNKAVVERSEFETLVRQIGALEK